LAGSLAALLAGLPGCGAPATGGGADDWSRGMGGALAIRAEDLARSGQAAEARQTALEAMELARNAGDGRAEARALAVLGKLDQDPQLLTRALELLELHAPPPAAWGVRLALAEQLLRTDRLPAAMEQLDLVVAQAEAHDEPGVRARYEAPARHLRALALGRLGQPDQARADNRRAVLVLSLLPDSQLRELRLALALAQGDDALARGRPAEAYALHTRARTLAGLLGDLPAEARALLAQAHDLAARGRFADAADRALLACEHGLSADDPELARRAALQGLGWSDDAGLDLDDQRRTALLDALRRLDLRAAGEPPGRPAVARTRPVCTLARRDAGDGLLSLGRPHTGPCPRHAAQLAPSPGASTWSSSAPAPTKRWPTSPTAPPSWPAASACAASPRRSSPRWSTRA